MIGKRKILSSTDKVKRRKSAEAPTYFQKTMQECGLTLHSPPKKCETSLETMYIIRNLKKSLKEHENYPRNVENFLAEFEKECQDTKVFEHYLYQNIVRVTDQVPNAYNLSDNVIKILLNVGFLQSKLVDYIFDKAIDHIEAPNFMMWIKMILFSFSNLSTVECSEKLSSKLIDFLDISSDKAVRLEIISAIPKIIGDKEHDNVASEMSRILLSLGSDNYLIPSILDCLTNLCLSDAQFERLQKETLEIVQPLNAAYFSNFIKLLLTPGRLSDRAYEETIQGLRQKLVWSLFVESESDIATSQVLTASAIRNSILSSKVIAKAWLKVISSCKLHTDHKSIDIILLLIMYSISDETQKQVESIMRKQIKLQIMKEDLLDDAFKKFKPILKEYLANLMCLANTLLKVDSEHLVQSFATHMYMVMFFELTDCCSIIVMELLQISLNSKNCVLTTLNILNNIASENMTLLKPQSVQILTLLDRMDDMTLNEIRAVWNLVCGLAFSFENSDIKDDVYIIMRKALGSSIPLIKIQGILAGIYAVKYLTDAGDDISKDAGQYAELRKKNHLAQNKQDATEIIELIIQSTKYFPAMIAFFYDELYQVIEQSTNMHKEFIESLTDMLTDNWQDKFLVDPDNIHPISKINLSMQLCLNKDSEVEGQWAVDIAGRTLGDNKEIETLSPLFQLVRVLHYKKDKGDLSGIDALLGFAIVMPIVNIEEIEDLNESSVKNILDCYVHCVNWIRELLNAFASQKDEDLKPKILNRLLQLRRLEKDIEQILLKKDMVYKPPSFYLNAVYSNTGNVKQQVERRVVKRQGEKHKKGKKIDQDDTVQPESRAQTAVSQPTQSAISIKNKLATIHNINFRPLNLTLIELLRYNLTSYESHENELTFEILTYLLNHLNGSLEKILVPKIKKKSFLTKETVELYNCSKAVTQAKIISEILPNLMDHVDVITSFLDGQITEEIRSTYDSLHASKLIESCLCLQYIHNLLTIYFNWFEFKNDHFLLLQNSLKTLAKIKSDQILSMDDLVKTVTVNLEKHEKYCLTLSSAVSLIELIESFQHYFTGSNITLILKDLSFKFLSKEWRTPDDQIERGLLYNQGINSLTRVYLTNSKMVELKAFVTSLESDVEKLRDRNSVLQSLQSVNKSNFSILLRNLGTAVWDKVKPHINGGSTNADHVEMWRSVAFVLKSMTNMVETLDNKLTSAAFFNKSIPILKLFLSKGLPILKIEIQDHRQSILELMKDFQVWTMWLRTICTQSNNSTLMKKIPDMKGTLTDFICKTKALLKSNKCVEALKEFIGGFNVNEEEGSRKKSKATSQRGSHVHDETVEDCDDDLFEDSSSDLSDNDQIDSVGVSEVL